MDSSSPSCLSPHCKFDVFISFKGEDTRYNFTSHLYAALLRKKIETFLDDEELQRGEEISPTLSSAIERSKISVIVFSKDYASSTWCLEELVKILHCHKTNGQIVIPIFYHVDPSDVRKQTGCFGEALVKHEKKSKKKQMQVEKVQKWRTVLTEASNLSGWASKEIRNEAQLVDIIVEDILWKLKDIAVSTDSEGFIGLDSQIEEIKLLLCMGLQNPRIVGIWGMGGIGKTTIAEALFEQISCEFEAKCFIANVREKSEQGVGLDCLQIQILSQLLKETLKMGGPNISRYTKDRLQRKKVLLVLDDVNKFKQIEYLVGRLDHFGPGSRVIVTTRDKGVLDVCRVDYIYKVKELKNHESLKLFCKYAFRQSCCPQDLLVLSKRMIDYAKGNPLALKILGSFLHKKGMLQWEGALDNLNRISNMHIYDVLKISYDELKLEEKNIFLDIACFLKGCDIGHVASILNDCYPMYYGLNILVDKSLITISNSTVEMHDLLQEMGQEIVRQESIKVPEKRSRLWRHEDVYHVLRKNKGIDSIEGILLDMSRIRDLHLSANAFAKMSKLRLLKFYMPNFSGNLDTSSRVHLLQGLDYLSEELRYFHWHGYPLKIFPSYFYPNNLVELHLPCSKIEKLWDGEKEAPKLKSIDLCHSQNLIEIPDLLKTPNLERLNLLNCINLRGIPSCIQNFNYLRELCLEGCESLGSFPRNIHFSSPIKIDFSYCVNLQEFPQISGNVVELHLSGTAIKEVPSSIKCLTKLEFLGLLFCKSLRSFQHNIHFSSSIHINCYSCSNLKEFPEISGNVKELDLHGTAIEEVASSIECLTMLEVLRMSSCGRLTSLPTSICKLKSLRELRFDNCSKLESFPEILEKMECLECLVLESTAIKELPTSIENLVGIRELRLTHCSELGRLPDSLRNLKYLKSIHAQMFQFPRTRKRRGFVLPSLSGLSSLTSLELSSCDIEDIPQDIGCASSLEWLDLSENNFEALPISIKQLSRLRFLFLSGCKRLQSIPELPIRLRLLDASNCKRLQSLPKLSSCLEELDASILETLSLLKVRSTLKANSENGIGFTFANCQKLIENAKDDILADSQLRIQHMIISLQRESYDLSKTYSQDRHPLYSIIGISLPGGGIPEWFSSRGSGASLTICLSSHRCNRKFIGFALSSVVEVDEAYNAGDFDYGVKCRYVLITDSLSETYDYYNFHASGYIGSEHLFLGFDSCWNATRPEGDALTAVSFEFIIIYNPFAYDQNNFRIDDEGRKGGRVKCCGVCPVYAHPSKTKSNTYILKFGNISEEECSECAEYRNLDDNICDVASTSGTTASISRSNQDEVETTCRDGLLPSLLCCLLGCG